VVVVVPKHQVLSRKMSKNIIGIVEYRLAGDVYGLVLSTLSSEEEEESAFTKMDLKKRAARYRMLLCQHL
jgi:DNA-directed RNA polymerase subunit H (RpoH/RPB5)